MQNREKVVIRRLKFDDYGQRRTSISLKYINIQ